MKRMQIANAEEEPKKSSKDYAMEDEDEEVVEYAGI